MVGAAVRVQPGRGRRRWSSRRCARRSRSAACCSPDPAAPPSTRTARDDLLARRRTLGDVLGAAGLPLRADLLAPWVRWVTPEAEPRRYDTAFFVAVVPDGQEADARTTEAVEATWWYPAEALDGAQRGDDVFATDVNPERSGREPDGPVDGGILCAPAAPLDALAPGGTVLVFSPASPIDLDEVYRRELTLVGSRSATPRHMVEACSVIGKLALPEPTVLPLDRFDHGLELYRSGAALKVVFTP